MEVEKWRSSLHSSRHSHVKIVFMCSYAAAAHPLSCTRLVDNVEWMWCLKFLLLLGDDCCGVVIINHEKYWISLPSLFQLKTKLRLDPCRLCLCNNVSPYLVASESPCFQLYITMKRVYLLPFFDSSWPRKKKTKWDRCSHLPCFNPVFRIWLYMRPLSNTFPSLLALSPLLTAGMW